MVEAKQEQVMYRYRVGPVQPDWEVAKVLEHVLNQFVARRKKDQISLQSRPQDELRWVITRSTPKVGEVLFSNVTIEFFDTDLGRELSLKPSSAVFLDGEDYKAPSSIPPKSIIIMEGQPSRDQLPEWSKDLDKNLKRVWRTALRWGRDPLKYLEL